MTAHEDCMKLLPWYVNGTLDGNERRRVEEHLGGCEICRAELDGLAEVQRSIREAPVDDLPAADPAGLLARLDAERAAPRRSPAWVRLVIAGQAAAIVALLGILAWPASAPPPQTFTTHSSTEVRQTGATLRIVFDEGITELELRGLLQSVDAEIVGGPSAVGAYTLRLDNADTPRETAGLARLRQHALVRLVEPVKVF